MVNIVNVYSSNIPPLPMNPSIVSTLSLICINFIPLQNDSFSAFSPCFLHNLQIHPSKISPHLIMYPIFLVPTVFPSGFDLFLHIVIIQKMEFDLIIL